MILGLVACEKDKVEAEVSRAEGYLSLDVVINPMIHPYAQSYSLTIDEARIVGSMTEKLVLNQELELTATAEPIRHTLSARAVLTPGGHSNLEVDFNTSATNGCNITTFDNRTDKLGLGEASVFTIQVGGAYLIENGRTTKRILFLDLNDLITTTTDGRTDFSFRENLTVSDNLHLFDPKEIGQVSGKVVRNEDTPSQTYRLVAYAYSRGTFNKQDELQNGFQSATISANVGRNDLFSFPILKEGTYDLIVAHYLDEDQDGILEFKELLQADASVGDDTRMTHVSANTETSIVLQVGGVVAD